MTTDEHRKLSQHLDQKRLRNASAAPAKTKIVPGLPAPVLPPEYGRVDAGVAFDPVPAGSDITKRCCDQ